MAAIFSCLAFFRLGKRSRMFTICGTPTRRPIMNAPDLDPLLRQLRESHPTPSLDLTSSVLARLGDSARQVRLVLISGAISCAAAMGLAFLIGSSVNKEPARPAPPQLTLLSGATNPLLSL